MQNTSQAFDRPVFQSLIGWILLIPILYFASMGILWYEAAARNNSLAATYGALATNPITSASKAISYLIVLVVLGVVLPRIRAVLTTSNRNKVFLALVAWAFISCIWSQQPRISFVSSAYLAVNTLFAFYLSSRFTSKRLMEMLLAIGWICLVLSIFLAVFLPHYGQSNLDEPGWKGMYDHKNICSLMTVLFMSVGFYVPAVSLLAKVSRFAYIGLSLLLIVMTQSATGKLALVGLFAYVFAMKTIERFSSRTKVFAIVGIVAVGSVLAVAGISYFSEITYLLGKDPTLTGRTQIWHAALISIMKHPILGYGYQAFWGGFQGESANVIVAAGFVMSQAHNAGLELWLSFGAVGLGLFFYAVAKASRDALSCISFGRSAYFAWYASVIFLILIMGLDEAAGVALPNSLPWMLFIVACVKLSEGARCIRSGSEFEIEQGMSGRASTPVP